MADTITFSEDQQAAVVGHGFRDPAIWEQLDELGAKKEWFVSARLGETFDHHAQYRIYYGHPPSTDELLAFVAANETPTATEAVKRTVEWCQAKAKSMSFADLKQKLVDWAKGRMVAVRATELAKVFNEGDHDKAYTLVQTLATELQKLDVLTGVSPDTLESAADRVDREEQQREEDSKALLQYGIPYLDDVTGGLLRKELVLLGARTGAGKTELATMIAKHNAKMGKRVAFFALEAEEYEIERRIKYSMLVERWRVDNDVRGVMNYADWRMFKLEKPLEPYKKAVNAEFKKNYKTLKTYYRVRGDFSPRELDREILKIYRETDLIILDHLHYVDLDGEDEHAEMKNLMKQLRRLALSLGIPIVCVAHFRKKNGVEAKSLAPDLEAFHGSSDITKIATTAIILAPAGEVTVNDARADGSPTFMRLVKFRLGGGRLSHVAISFFDPETNLYREDYALGRFNMADTKWSPTTDHPKWATRATINDLAEVQ